MSQHKRNDELTDTTLQPCPPKEPNAESLEAIREGDAFFASGELGLSTTPPTLSMQL